MIPAKLIKNLEKIGFELDFPSYDSKEKLIAEIIKQDNDRLNLALPLLIKDGIDYSKLKKQLSEKRKSKFDQYLIITNEILKKENLNNDFIKLIINNNKIKEKIPKETIFYSYDFFKEAIRRKELESDKEKISEIKARNKLTTNKALRNIFSPGKRKIMEKIYNHEPLTNTELKYYYRSIRPLNKAILNDNMKDYIRIIENSKKRVEE